MEDNLTMPQVLRREEAQNLVKELGGTMFLLAAMRRSLPLGVQSLVEELAGALLAAVAHRQTAETALAKVDKMYADLLEENKRIAHRCFNLEIELGSAKHALALQNGQEGGEE